MCSIGIPSSSQSTQWDLSHLQGAPFCLFGNLAGQVGWKPAQPIVFSGGRTELDALFWGLWQSPVWCLLNISMSQFNPLSIAAWLTGGCRRDGFTLQCRPKQPQVNSAEPAVVERVGDNCVVCANRCLSFCWLLVLFGLVLLCVCFFFF